MIELPELKRALRKVSARDDAELKILEARAVRLIERETRRYYGPARNVNDFICPMVSGPILTVVGPIISLSYVRERAYPGATTYTDIDEYTRTVRAPNLIVRTDGGLFGYGCEYEVGYSQGWTPGEEPEDIRGAVKQLVALWYEQPLSITEAANAANVPHNVAEVIAANRRKRT